MTVRGRSRLESNSIVEEPVYTDDSLMTGVLPLAQKLRVLKRLCKHDPLIGIYHFFMAASPPVGEAFFYVVEYTDSLPRGYGTESAAKERVVPLGLGCP